MKKYCVTFKIIWAFQPHLSKTERIKKPNEIRDIAGNNRGGKRKKQEGGKDKIWEIALQSPIEHRILNRLDPEGCNNNTGDNNNQRSQYHAIHDLPYAF